VAWKRANVKARAADREDVIDLAGMDDSDEGIAHNDKVQIGRGERVGESLQGLVGQAKHVVERVECGEIDDLAEFAAPTDENKREIRFGAHGVGGPEDGIERVTGAMVAGVHHYELAGETV
jgi:hypothetical protein